MKSRLRRALAVDMSTLDSLTAGAAGCPPSAPAARRRGCDPDDASILVVYSIERRPWAGEGSAVMFRGNFFPREFVPLGTNSLGTSFFEPANLFPTRYPGNLFPVYLPYRTSLQPLLTNYSLCSSCAVYGASLSRLTYD